ncbi:MAG: HAMP domain-containing sensor histidine kinase [Candidatus Dojkabacteria bacterium]
MIMPLFIIDFVLPIFFNNTVFYKYSALGNILWSIIIGYSIINTRFLDVRLVLGNLLKVFFKTIYILGVIVLVVFVLIPQWYFTNDLRTLLLSIPVSIILGLILSSLIKNYDAFIENRLIYSAYNPIEELQKYSHSNANTLSILEIVTNTKRSLLEALAPNKIYVSIVSKDTNKEYLSNQIDTNGIDQKDYDRFLADWQDLNSYRILVYSEIRNTPTSGKKIIDTRKQNITNFMAKYHIEIVVPIQSSSMMNGLIMLSEKRDNSIYTLGDINFIESISQNMSLRIGQAALYAQVQDLNSSLQQKVSEQTQELQNKVKLLEEARRKEADMIDIMGHELRTPMSIVKLNTDLLHNFTHNVERRQEDFKKYVKRIKDAVDTEIKLINTLLSSAKLEGDKIELNPEKVDIIDQIKMALHAQESRAKKKGVEIFSKLDTNNRYVFSDHARTVEILNNLIDNAVKYTQKGSVTVTTEDEEEYVKISVIDTGEGMSQEDVENLGSKFFRTSNYTKSEYSDDIDIVRPGGTGLGLYVTFNLIRKMGGEIDVKSKLGEGSIFSFTLPKYVGQKSTPVADSKDMFSRLGLRE